MNKLTDLIRQVAFLVQRRAEQTTELAQLRQKKEKLQPGIEDAFLRLWAAEKTGASFGRIEELKADYIAQVAQGDAGQAALKREIEKTSADTRRITSPTIRGASEWLRQTYSLAPYDEQFSAYVNKALQEIQSMELKPLNETITAIERHQRKIENWEFAEKPKAMLPALRLQDLVAA